MNVSIFPYRSLFAYFKAIATVAITSGILYLFRNNLGLTLVGLLYLLPVVFSTTFWGFGAGIASAVTSFMAFNFLFIEPYYTLVVFHARDMLVLVVFLLVAVVISQLVGRAQSSLAHATARELETSKLYELSTALAGVQSSQSIINIVSQQILATFQPERLEFSVKDNLNSISKDFSYPREASIPTSSSLMILPILTPRGQLGEVRLWTTQSLAPSEERLLKTFISQGAVALERAWLVENETRTKVLEESDRLKTALLSSVSHELRTPLSTIKAAISSLRSGEAASSSSTRDDLLSAVEEETDHLNRLVGNLLDMSRIESGALHPKRQWNLIVEIVGSVIQHMGRLTETHRLVIEIPENLPLVPVDYVQMEQVFTNLISNSIKYAPTHSSITIRAWQATDMEIQVQVANQGPPVPEEHLDKIFNKFYRVTAADRVTGTGLGLSICKGIIDAHGGSIWAENLSNGFAFNFKLPFLWEGSEPPKIPSDLESA